MSYEDSTSRFVNYDTLFEDLFYSTPEDVENGPYYTPVTILISLFLCSIFFIFHVILTWWHDVPKHEVLLNLYLTYSGDSLCSSCKKKAGRENKFIEEQLYTLKVLDFVRVQVFNPFDDKCVTSDPQRMEHPNADACFYIHNCGGLESVEYEMISDRPSHLIGLPSLQYNCVFIEETEINKINLRLFNNCPRFVQTVLVKFAMFVGNFEYDFCSEKYFCSGSILTTEKIKVHKMRVAAASKFEKT